MEKFADIGPVILVALVVAFFAVLLVRTRGRAQQITIPQEEQERLAFEVAPKCICGEVATHPLPRLRRSRGSWLRKLFAAPPSYRREVDPMLRQNRQPETGAGMMGREGFGLEKLRLGIA